MAAPGRSMGTYCQAVRLLKLLDALRGAPQGLLLPDLASEFEVSERQIWRDLAALGQAGYAYELGESDGHRRRIVLEEGRGGKLGLTVRQRFVLLAARRVFDVLGGTPFAEDIGHIYAQVLSSLPADTRRKLNKTIQGRFVFLADAGPKNYDKHGDVIDGLLTGALHRMRVSFRYKRPDGYSFEGLLEPYAMVLYRQGLYVLGSTVHLRGSTLERQSPRVYAVERFSRADHQREVRFELPPGFDVDRYFDGVFGIFGGGESTQHVVIDFSPEARQLVEARRWHPTQKLQRRRDGSVRLSMDVVNTTEVVPWVMGWGALAHVQAPADLAQRVARELDAAAQRYAKPRKKRASK